MSYENPIDGWRAPGKLNLFLHVTGRTANGYHSIQTIFQFIDIFDVLHFEPREDGEIRRLTNPELPEDDLCVRAAQLLSKHASVDYGVNISLTKNLPAGAGLGGGSSDAATTLIALNSLWDLELTRSELAHLGLKLGADVPVFIHGHAAWAEGVGEKISPVFVPERHFCVIWPKIEVSTYEIFMDGELTRNSLNITIRDFLEGNSRNDLETVTRKRYPAVDRAVNWLSQFGDARMTGSGAAIFVAVDRESDGRDILKSLPEGFDGFVTCSMNVHPLLDVR